MKLHSGDTIIFSATPIPGNERAVNETVDRLYQIGATVITTQDAAVHASGHGWSEEIKLMLNLTQPKYVMPIHGDHKRLYLHGQLAEAVGVDPDDDLPRAQRAAARDRRGGRAVRRAGADRASCSWTASRSGTSRTSRCATGARCRRTASSSWSRPSRARTAGRSRRRRSSPRGVPFLAESDGVLDDLRETVEESLAHAAADEVHEISLLQEHLREDVAAFIYDRLRRRPMVLPVVVEV